jgi:hypothetical protein
MRDAQKNNDVNGPTRRITPRLRRLNLVSATPKKVGRPKSPKGEAKGRIVPVRFTADDLKAMEQAAKASDKGLSERIRSTIHTNLKA